jgi:hypothetical protein
VVPARMLSSDISCRRTRPFCAATHTRPANHSDSSRRSTAAESTSGRPHLAAEFDAALLLIDVVSVAHLFFIPEPEMCLILRDGYSCEFPQAWLSCQADCGKHLRIGVGSGHRCYTSKL